MMTAMLSVENVLSERRIHNPWNVNEDAEYHEAGPAGFRRRTECRMVPRSNVK